MVLCSAWCLHWSMIVVRRWATPCPCNKTWQSNISQSIPFPIANPSWSLFWSKFLGVFFEFWVLGPASPYTAHGDWSTNFFTVCNMKEFLEHEFLWSLRHEGVPGAGIPWEYRFLLFSTSPTFRKKGSLPLQNTAPASKLCAKKSPRLKSTPALLHCLSHFLTQSLTSQLDKTFSKKLRLKLMAVFGGVLARLVDSKGKKISMLNLQ